MTAAMRKADDRVRVVTLTPAEARAYCAVLRLLESGELPTIKATAAAIGRSKQRAVQLIRACIDKGALRRRGKAKTGLGPVAGAIVRLVEAPPTERKGKRA